MVQDEVGSLEPTASIVSAVKGNDSFHPTMSIFCGIQCGPQSWDAHVYRQIAAVHDVFGIDSCATAALPLPLLQPDCLAPDCLVPDSRPQTRSTSTLGSLLGTSASTAARST